MTSLQPQTFGKAEIQRLNLGVAAARTWKETTVLKRAVFTDSDCSGCVFNGKTAVALNSFSLCRWGCLWSTEMLSGIEREARLWTLRDTVCLCVCVCWCESGSLRESLNQNSDSYTDISWQWLLISTSGPQGACRKAFIYQRWWKMCRVVAQPYSCSCCWCSAVPN